MVQELMSSKESDAEAHDQASNSMEVSQSGHFFQQSRFTWRILNQHNLKGKLNYVHWLESNLNVPNHKKIHVLVGHFQLKPDSNSQTVTNSADCVEFTHVIVIIHILVGLKPDSNSQTVTNCDRA